MIIDDGLTSAGYMVFRWVDLFKKTGNPIYAWRAYRNARRLRTPIPDEVLQYLDGAADGIIYIADKEVPAKNRPSHLAQALGLAKVGAGRGSAFEKYNGRSLQIAMDTYEALLGTETEYAVHQEIAEKYGISESKVRRDYKAHMELWKLDAQRLIDDGLVVRKGDGWQVNFKVAGNAQELREASIILSFLKDS